MYKVGKKWRARLRIGSKVVTVGYFPTEFDAALARDKAAAAHFGKYAVLNFPDGTQYSGRNPAVGRRIIEASIYDIKDNKTAARLKRQHARSRRKPRHRVTPGESDD